MATQGVTIDAAEKATLADKTTLDAINAKTTNLPANPAATTDVPTAGAIASQVDSTLTTAHGAGAWSASDATLAKQDAILVAVGQIGGGSAVSANVVNRQRKWILADSAESSVAPQIITVRQGEDLTLAMDFSSWINEDTALSTVSSVTDDLSLLTIDNLLVDQARQNAHFDVTGFTATQTHTLQVSVTTTDGQTMTGTGVLQVVA